MSVNGDFTNYVSDIFTDWIAQNDDCHDFIVRQGDQEIVYVDVEDNSLWLIRCAKGQAQAAQTREDPEADREKVA